MKLVISEEEVRDFLRSQNFKPTPEVVKAILEEVEKTDMVAEIISSVMFNTCIPTLENL